MRDGIAGASPPKIRLAAAAAKRRSEVIETKRDADICCGSEEEEELEVPKRSISAPFEALGAAGGVGADGASRADRHPRRRMQTQRTRRARQVRQSRPAPHRHRSPPELWRSLAAAGCRGEAEIRSSPPNRSPTAAVEVAEAGASKRFGEATKPSYARAVRRHALSNCPNPALDDFQELRRSRASSRVDDEGSADNVGRGRGVGGGRGDGEACVQHAEGVTRAAAGVERMRLVSQRVHHASDSPNVRGCADVAAVRVQSIISGARFIMVEKRERRSSSSSCRRSAETHSNVRADVDPKSHSFVPENVSSTFSSLRS